MMDENHQEGDLPDRWLPKAGSAWLRYGAAVLAIAAAVLLDKTDFLSGGFRIYLVFYPFIILATLYGGVGPGLLAITLSAMAANFFLIEPIGRFAIAAHADRISLAVFIAGNLLVVWICEWLRRANRQAAQADAYRKIASDRERQGQILRERDSERERLLQEARAAREQAEKANQAKEQFIAVLSHELRTPLTPVLATVTALEEQSDLSAETRNDMELVHRNVAMEAALIDDLLDVTGINAGKIVMQPKAADLQVCLQAALKICQNEIEAKHLNLSLELSAERHHVWADPTRLQQVFWNLLRNAVKFTPEGGRISVRSTNDDGCLRVEIIDTGIGIPPEVLPRVFNAFEQGEKTTTRFFGGLGLGLSIAKAIVEMHHGSLIAFSEGKDKGAAFTVELPTIAAVPEPSTPPPASMPHSERFVKILLVEDHADTLQTMAKLLRLLGHAVTTATSVRHALELSATQRYDLIISDLGLPDGSGLEIIREAKKLYPLQGIAFSGYGTKEDIRQSREAGFAEHMIKPVSFDTLREAIHRVVSNAA